MCATRIWNQSLAICDVWHKWTTWIISTNKIGVDQCCYPKRKVYFTHEYYQQIRSRCIAWWGNVSLCQERMPKMWGIRFINICYMKTFSYQRLLRFVQSNGIHFADNELQRYWETSNLLCFWTQELTKTVWLCSGWFCRQYGGFKILSSIDFGIYKIWHYVRHTNTTIHTWGWIVSFRHSTKYVYE